MFYSSVFPQLTYKLQKHGPQLTYVIGTQLTFTAKRCPVGSKTPFLRCFFNNVFNLECVARASSRVRRHVFVVRSICRIDDGRPGATNDVFANVKCKSFYKRRSALARWKRIFNFNVFKTFFIYFVW